LTSTIAKNTPFRSIKRQTYKPSKIKFNEANIIYRPWSPNTK